MQLLDGQARAIVEGCGLRPVRDATGSGGAAAFRIDIDPIRGALRLEIGPGAIVTVDLRERVDDRRADELLTAAGLDAWVGFATEPIVRLAAAFADHEMLRLEVVLALRQAPSERVVFTGARVVCDDNAAFRNERVAQLLAEVQPEPTRRLKALGVDYVRLDGPVGLMSVGAGESMAAMDLLDAAGCPAACFLDISGGFGVDALTAAFRQIASLPALRAVLVNVFGGLTRVDRVAESILAALDAIGELPVPLVLRLEGTDAERGRALVTARGLRCERTLRDAIAAAAAAAAGGRA